jgi:hypothetical protein
MVAGEGSPPVTAPSTTDRLSDCDDKPPGKEGDPRAL